MPGIRGLKLLETIDVYGPLTVTEIAQLTGQHKSWVSRIVGACEPDGWIVRENGRIALGPRAALLAYGSAAGELIRRAQPLIEVIAGVTGLTAQAYRLVGMRATVIAAAGGSAPLSSVGVGMSTSLVATAAGQAIATQIEPARLDLLLPHDPFPDPLAELLSNPGYRAFASGRFASLPVDDIVPNSLPGNRAELDARLELVREEGMAIDLGDLHPQIGCIAAPWPAGDGAALTCVGSPAELSSSAELVRTVLTAAVAPAATREDVVVAAAAVGDGAQGAHSMQS
jgi:DNA-binding IclR family transcriptional regulator